MRFDDGSFWCGVFVGSAMAVAAMFIALFLLREDYRRGAVNHGCAQWVMDPATGSTEWQWKEVQP